VRLRIVAALCAIWAVIEGWFQFQQVVLNRETWSNQVQNWMSLAIAALVIALLGYIFHEQRLAADERAELRGELTAARQVQHLLVPDKMQVAPGITVSSAFLPAHEVGGDFYLCRALANGAQRVLLGDVSGKGVAAALTSALLLGAADRCDDLRPAAVLKELNAALRNSGIEGFTTCLCADLSSTGVLLIANAGQLPPYRNGAEIEIPCGLPLGVDAAAEYFETSIQLAPGDRLTFISDGVTEARNAAGELFGFERTRQLSSRAAQQIADAAVEFGQQDDITVLTLSLAARAVPA
jgi:serine phosphatase RsbU (regulator of sigma subunit)